MNGSSFLIRMENPDENQKAYIVLAASHVRLLQDICFELRNNVSDQLRIQMGHEYRGKAVP